MLGTLTDSLAYRLNTFLWSTTEGPVVALFGGFVVAICALIVGMKPAAE